VSGWVQVQGPAIGGRALVQPLCSWRLACFSAWLCASPAACFPMGPKVRLSRSGAGDRPRQSTNMMSCTGCLHAAVEQRTDVYSGGGASSGKAPRARRPYLWDASTDAVAAAPHESDVGVHPPCGTAGAHGLHSRPHGFSSASVSRRPFSPSRAQELKCRAPTALGLLHRRLMAGGLVSMDTLLT
jgi:hypothetical protein